MKARVATVLVAVCPRVFVHGTAPLGVARPYVTYTTFAAKAINYIDGGDPSIEHAAFQISVWGASQPQADAMMKAIDSALCAATAFQCERLTGRIDAAYEPDTKLFGSIQRFSVWASR